MIESSNGKKGPIGPLNGVKVVDLSSPLAGSICTMILSDMGAKTITIERPGTNSPGQFSYLHRNKKRVTLNLKTDRGKDILRRLIDWGDVLVESYRPGVMKRMGFDYPSVRDINPRIVMTSISGYGQEGPYAHRGAFDTVGQAMGGIMSLTGPAEGPPWDAGAALADLSTAVFAALGTAMALYHQQATGLGQHVESSLVESIVFLMVPELMEHLAGRVIEKGSLGWWKRRPAAGWFQTKDGSYIVIMAQADQHWRRMAEIMDCSELAEAPGYATRGERVKNAKEIHELMEAWTRKLPPDKIETILDQADIPFGRVQSIEEVLKDPNLNSRGMFKEMDIQGKIMRMFGPYPILSDTPGSFTAPLKSGESNKEVYGSLLGFSTKELRTLKKDSVI